MKLSIVDLSVVQPGEDPGQSLAHSIVLAKKAEELGYDRIWYSEHHGKAVVSRAPEVMISTVAANTSKIRVGAGSILMNHYSAYKVAEVFCTLNELYPERIDLGIGRATVTPTIDLALQQDRSSRYTQNSEAQLDELLNWMDDSFKPDDPFSKVPIHTIASRPEIHLTGTSTWSSTAAGLRGLRYVHAGFFSTDITPLAVQNYRRHFIPSTSLLGVQEPEVRLGVHVVCADSEDEARRQLAPVLVLYQNLHAGKLLFTLPTPDEAVKMLGGLPYFEPYEKGSGIPPRYIYGKFENVAEQLHGLTKDLGVNELILQDMMTDQVARHHSYKLLAGLL